MGIADFLKTQSSQGGISQFLRQFHAPQVESEQRLRQRFTLPPLTPLPKERKPIELGKVGTAIKEFFFPRREIGGVLKPTEEALREAKPSPTEVVLGATKLGAEILQGTAALGDLFLDITGLRNISPKSPRFEETKVGRKLQEFAVPKTVEEAAAMRVVDAVFWFPVGSLKIGTGVAQTIARTKNAPKIANILKTEIKGLTDEGATLLSKLLTPVDNVDDVQKVINRTDFAINKAKGVNQALTRVGDVSGITKATTPAPTFGGFDDITTKVLDELVGKTVVKSQFISDLTNQGALKQAERDLIRETLKEFPEGNIPVQEFADKVKTRLLPLDRVQPGGLQNRYENISLSDELRGNVANYAERIYQSPIKNSAGEVHFSGLNTDRYFAHVRVEDMAKSSLDSGRMGELRKANLERKLTDTEVKEFQALQDADNAAGSTRRIIEIQSDLFQKGRLDSSVQTFGGIQDAARKAEIAQLQPYRNTWHERIIREEIRRAAIDGKTKLQFPTGETAMKIEGLGDRTRWSPVNTREGGTPVLDRLLKESDLKVGKAVHDGDSEWIITDVLGEGRFKATPKHEFDRLIDAGQSKSNALESLRSGQRPGINQETFDISGKIDTKNPIYRFYEKDVHNYLRKNFGGKKVTDDNGVEWTEVDVNKAVAKQPVEALGIAGVGFARRISPRGVRPTARQKGKTIDTVEKGVVPKTSPNTIRTQLKTVENQSGKLPPEQAPPKHQLPAHDRDGVFKLPEEKRFQAFRRSVEDYNLRLKILNNEIEKVTGQAVPEQLDLWAQKDMLPRVQSDAIRRVRDIKVDFVRRLTADNIRVEQLDEYLHALHAKERNAAMNARRAELGKPPVDGLSGMTDAKAATILSRANTKLHKYAKEVHKIADNVLEETFREGLLTQKAYLRIKSKYQNYVPLFRNLGEDFTGIGVGQGVSVPQQEIKRAVGSTKEVLSPTGNVFHRMERIKTVALKNQVGKTIVELTREFPFLKDIFKIEKSPTTVIAKREIGGELVDIWGRATRAGDNVVLTKINGSEHFITVSDQKIAQALKGINIARVPQGVRFMGILLSIWSGFKTRWRPEFLLTNFERDLGEAIVNLNVEGAQLGKEAGRGLIRKIVKDVFPSQRQIWKYVRGGQDDVADEFFRLGGDTGHFWLEDTKKAEKSLLQIQKEILNVGVEKLKNPVRRAGEVVDNLQTMVELGLRFSAYKNLTARGMSKQRAIQSAADLTVNFSRQGELSPFLKLFWGFINPTIQGASKVVRSITSKTGRRRVLGAVTALVSLGFLTRLISHSIDPEGDEQINDWAKNHRLIFATGNGNTITLWQMPYGYTAFYALGSNAAEVMLGTKTLGEGFKNTYETTIDSFSPFGTNLNDLMPTLAKPLFDINMNKAWYDGKIFPEQIYTDTPKPDHKAYFESTSKSAIFITELLSRLTGGGKDKAGLIDIHPDSLEYAYDQFFGGPFEFVTSSIEAGARGVQGEFDPNKTPFVRQFFRNQKPQQWSYGIIFDTLERAYKKDVSELEKERFYRAVDTGLESNVFDKKKADGYIRDFVKAQYQITGSIDETPNVFKILRMPAEDRDRLLGTYSESTIKQYERVGNTTDSESASSGELNLDEFRAGQPSPFTQELNLDEFRVK